MENYNAEEVVNAKKGETAACYYSTFFPVIIYGIPFGTRFCEKETNIKVIQAVMGHANIETTMDIYAEVTDAKKKGSIETYHTILNNILGKKSLKLNV